MLSISYALIANAQITGSEDTAEVGYSQHFLVAQNIPPTPPISFKIACSCILYLKKVLGITQPLGIARDVPTTSERPYIGGIVLTYESRWGHAAIIRDIRDGKLILEEANYEKCKVTHGRELSLDSSLIRGYR